jgi:hypothetical protein
MRDGRTRTARCTRPILQLGLVLGAASRFDLKRNQKTCSSIALEAKAGVA